MVYFSVVSYIKELENGGYKLWQFFLAAASFCKFDVLLSIFVLFVKLFDAVLSEKDSNCIRFHILSKCYNRREHTLNEDYNNIKLFRCNENLSGASLMDAITTAVT